MSWPRPVRGFARLPLRWQFMALAVGVLALGQIVLLLFATPWRQAQALERARAIAAVADAVGVWSSRYRGVWVLSDATDPGVSVGEALDHRQVRAFEDRTAGPVGAAADSTATVQIARTAGTFHRKVPSAVQRELSEVLARVSSGERLRVTTDPPLDSRHAPDGFEREAIARLRAETGTAEVHTVERGHLLYARRLVASADCLRCHAAPVTAPVAMQHRFAGSPGWTALRDGDFAGIVSVSVPLRAWTPLDVVAGPGAGAGGLLAAWSATSVVLLAWLQRRVIVSADALEDYTQRLLAARNELRASRVPVDADEIGSRNEMHRLSMALRALHRHWRHAAPSSP